jgi:hypothetical protein
MTLTAEQQQLLAEGDAELAAKFGRSADNYT